MRHEVSPIVGFIGAVFGGALIWAALILALLWWRS